MFELYFHMEFCSNITDILVAISMIVTIPVTYAYDYMLERLLDIFNLSNSNWTTWTIKIKILSFYSTLIILLIDT